MEKKICKKCGIEKYHNEFGKDKSKKDGCSTYCIKCKRLVDKEWRNKNPEKQRLYEKNWLKNNIIHRNEYIRKYEKDRKNTDPIFKLTTNARTRINIFLKSKNIKKVSSTFEMIGCNPEELKKHLERQFSEGMNWDNYGYYGWHVDHKIPLDSGKTEDDIYKLCHYSNLQPMWWDENLKKGYKIL